jgi:hypothetical protein
VADTCARLKMPESRCLGCIQLNFEGVRDSSGYRCIDHKVDDDRKASCRDGNYDKIEGFRSLSCNIEYSHD